jgi:hypothetical protein
MGQVVPFRRKSSLVLNETELALLTSLNGSLEVRSRGGWATRGKRHGVVLRQEGRPLGYWSSANGTYRYTSFGETTIVMVVATLEEAHMATLHILGSPRHLYPWSNFDRPPA